jgi:hypothetical protein
MSIDSSKSSVPEGTQLCARIRPWSHSVSLNFRRHRATHRSEDSMNIVVNHHSTQRGRRAHAAIACICVCIAARTCAVDSEESEALARGHTEVHVLDGGLVRVHLAQTFDANEIEAGIKRLG